MTSVSVSELKANLSRYLREVRRGGEIQVLDRGSPVARLVPEQEVGDRTRELLIKSGLLRPGNGNSSAVLNADPLALPASLVEALDQDRADRL
ncbi:MAG: type II toxin-antitoxin system prevent-host-death family antitoxin [Acidimicrobiaceae bacterium]|nr:type II toxin-antitoxin system prevent-host-death family antitoxin [Acidimicrobiaceae bacterium]MXW62433.1 type II toxin-antitoxin system prevent-host-death family antitoxin [Acidimicrobiaceae bacterium]MXW77383.1 type II toxin-antitoxin system prevent-host-death family antitoxin [Acidimicrobiaceae bacterium]MYA74659.1 type II toxin-antitoxin system prevent-host-death family antitoxin [Acidimicrobiaceae bacterium]MYC41431.1 type II toxin-antitoxin system prevent-host-death family antitoxin [